MSIFKDTFTEKVKDQLTIRGNAFLKRTSNDIIYINGRTAWARMVSGVDVGGDSKLAKENILQGGLLQNDGKSLRQGVGNNFTSNAYSNITNNTNNFYGLRPMPGITSINVQSKSAYGSVRVATVTFNCWDIRQLELLELLYMRPGFVLLLEWGWLPYLDNKGNIVTNLKNNFYDIFDSSRISPKTGKPISLHERLIEVYNKSQENDANYEGILGYIKNYSWSQRPDGGYDCTTEIISTGEVLESLKVNYSVNYISPTELKNGILFTSKKSSGASFVDNTKYGESIAKFYQNNILAGIAAESIFAAYTKIDEENKEDSDLNKGLVYPIIDNGSITGTVNHAINLFIFKIEANSTDEQKDEQKSSKIDPNIQVYIDLDSFTKIISKHVVPSNPDNGDPLVSLTTKSREYISGSVSSPDLYCLYHPLQISMDPRICLIKNDLFRKALTVNPTYNPPSTVWNITDLPRNEQGFALLLKSYIKIFLNALTTTITDDDAQIKYIQQTIINLQLRAASYGITDIKIIGKFLANAWEEYKFQNSNTILGDVTTASGTVSTITDINYTGILNNNIRFNPLNGRLYPDEKNFINEISGFDFITVLKIKLKGRGNSIGTDQELKSALGEEYSKVYVPDTNVALAAKDAIIAKINDLKEDKNRENIKFEGIEFLDRLPKNFRESTNGKSLGNIGNIYINLLNVINLATDGNLEANDVKEKQDINLYDFIKKLMGQVQSSIGNVNNFDIHVDPIDGIGRIIDINYVDEKKTSDAYANAFTFISQPDNLGLPAFNGLVNNVRSYKINSKIFKEQSSIVAISAQNGGGVMGLDNETLVGFQKGLTNRLALNTKPTSAPYIQSQGAQIIGVLNQSLSLLVTFLEDLNWIPKRFWPDKEREYDIENSEKYKNALRDMIRAYITFSKNSTAFKAIIPTTVSLELDGIGGIIIGHMFRLPDEVLPLGYKGDQINQNKIGRKLGYIVTGLGHKITDSDWTTNIEAQTIILEDPETTTELDFFKLLESADATDEITVDVETGQTTIKEANTSVSLPTVLNTSEQDFWTLVAICATEAGALDAQGQADVAQSLYNRLGSKAYSATSITKLILKKGQYEPTWRFPKGSERGKNNPNPSWYGITNASTAATATGLNENQLSQVARNIQNPELQRQATQFIQGRTDFLGKDQSADAMTANGSKKQRNTFSNKFGFSFSYTKNTTYPVPNFINKIKI
jgi:hypothetical protein